VFRTAAGFSGLETRAHENLQRQGTLLLSPFYQTEVSFPRFDTRAVLLRRLPGSSADGTAMEPDRCGKR
jgi:hypothetical protein